MQSKYRTHKCGKLTEQEIDKTVKVAGFVENIRDHGGVIFVDVRDETGMMQITWFNQPYLKSKFQAGKKYRFYE